MEDESRIDKMEQKINDIHTALIGDEYGNKGYSHRLTRLEHFAKKWERMLWMVAGGAAVISIIINLIWKIV